MLLKFKPKDDTKLKFSPMGAKPDVENAADAKKPGDAKEDAVDHKKSKAKTKSKSSYFAKKAATVLAAKK